MNIEDLKARKEQDKETLREQMRKEWYEIVKDKMINVAALFGIKFTDDAQVKSRRIRK